MEPVNKLINMRRILASCFVVSVIALTAALCCVSAFAADELPPDIVLTEDTTIVNLSGGYNGIERQTIDTNGYTLTLLNTEDTEFVGTIIGSGDVIKTGSGSLKLSHLFKGVTTVFAEFQYTGKTYPPGDFVDRDGNILGTHKGIIHYTIGQRRGLEIAAGKRQYVCSIDTELNCVVLGQDKDLYTKTLIAKNINLISLEVMEKPMRLKAKVRYRHTEQWATVIQLESDTLRVSFDEPQRAVTKGQSVVLYDGDIVVGGGIIK